MVKTLKYYSVNWRRIFLQFTMAKVQVFVYQLRKKGCWAKGNANSNQMVGQRGLFNQRSMLDAALWYPSSKNGENIFVEEKGTSSQKPRAILITANEVDLHKENKGKTALAIVSAITLVKDSEATAFGGNLNMKIGWDIDDLYLRSTAFRVENKNLSFGRLRLN